jgi:Flp pilus assembly protein TadB
MPDGLLVTLILLAFAALAVAPGAAWLVGRRADRRFCRRGAEFWETMICVYREAEADERARACA